MNRHDDIANAQDSDLRASLAAIQRAAGLARQTAMQTSTGLVIVRDERLVRIQMQKLRNVAKKLETEDRVTEKQTDDANEQFDPRQFFGAAHESRQAVDDYLATLRDGWH